MGEFGVPLRRAVRGGPALARVRCGRTWGTRAAAEPPVPGAGLGGRWLFGGSGGPFPWLWG